LRRFWYHLKGLLKGFWWPFRSSKLVKYSWSYGPNEVCDNLTGITNDSLKVIGWRLSLLKQCSK